MPINFNGDVEIAWSKHWGNGPTECTIMFKGIDDERFEEVRQGLCQELDEAEIEAAPIEGDHVALEN
jgi:hypothetical protein